MKTFQIGKYMFSFTIANGKEILQLSDKYFAEHTTNIRGEGVYTEYFFSLQRRHYLKQDVKILWIFIWCFLIGIGLEVK